MAASVTSAIRLVEMLSSSLKNDGDFNDINEHIKPNHSYIYSVIRQKFSKCDCNIVVDANFCVRFFKFVDADSFIDDKSQYPCSFQI